MSDIVERLRFRADETEYPSEFWAYREAADTIEAMRAENARLKEERDDHKRQSELHRVMWQKTDEAHDEAVNEIARLREALKSILTIPAKPIHLTQNYTITVPEYVIFEAAGVLERSCKKAKNNE